MATPSIIQELTVIDDFEDANLNDRLWEIGGTTGSVGANTSNYKQGTQSGGYMPGFASAWVTGIAIELLSSVDLSDEFLWTWYNISDKIFGNLDTIANGGLRLRIYTGTLVKDTGSDSLVDASCNYHEYYIGGIDTLRSGWARFVCKPASMTPIASNGTVDLSDVTAIGFITKFSSNLSGVNSHEFWIDIFHIGDGIQFAGGTEADPVNIQGIMEYTEDNSRKMGIVVAYEGIYFLNGKFVLGDAGNSVYMYEDRQLFVFSGHYYYDGANILSATGDGFHGFVSQNADNTLKWLNHSIRVADVDLVSWDLDFSTIQGSFITLQSSIYGAHDIKLCPLCYLRAVLNFCDNVVAGGANMDDCSFVVNVYFWVDSTNTPKNISLMYSYYGILAGDGVLHLSNYSFDDCTYELTHFDAGTLEVYEEDGTNIDPAKIYESGGGNTILYNKRTKSFTGLPEDTEARVVQGSFTLDHVQSVTGGVYEYTHDVTNRTAKVYFTKPGYVFVPIEFTLDDKNSNFIVNVRTNPSYI